MTQPHSLPLDQLQASGARLQRNIERVVHGKSEIIELALTCLLAEGHLHWDSAHQRFDPERSDAAPPALTRACSLSFWVSATSDGTCLSSALVAAA